MQLVIEPGGVVRCVYGEEIDQTALGSPTISRASHVEPDQQGRWWGRHGAGKWTAPGAIRASE